MNTAHIQHQLDILNKCLPQINSGAIYRDILDLMLGTTGVDELIRANKLECCGSINGRKLYTL